ncbi:hypothetical protein U9M48_013931 [Paspalum notatum var. saurae]|uniref:Uncharacterized protein n=1 Tax=Paspalum notatum var. saurae TaxID=547442 RepID=A0AAQ3T080_PASNO
MKRQEPLVFAGERGPTMKRQEPLVASAEGSVSSSTSIGRQSHRMPPRPCRRRRPLVASAFGPPRLLPPLRRSPARIREVALRLRSGVTFTTWLPRPRFRRRRLSAREPLPLPTTTPRQLPLPRQQLPKIHAPPQMRPRLLTPSNKDEGPFEDEDNVFYILQYQKLPRMKKSKKARVLLDRARNGYF